MVHSRPDSAGCWGHSHTITWSSSSGPSLHLGKIPVPSTNRVSFLGWQHYPTMTISYLSSCICVTPYLIVTVWPLVASCYQVLWCVTRRDCAMWLFPKKMLFSIRCRCWNTPARWREMPKTSLDMRVSFYGELTWEAKLPNSVDMSSRPAATVLLYD